MGLTLNDLLDKYNCEVSQDEDFELTPKRVVIGLIKSTLNNSIIKPGRSVGNTTRQINRAIECLFTDGAVTCLDHYQGDLS